MHPPEHREAPAAEQPEPEDRGDADREEHEVSRVGVVSSRTSCSPAGTGMPTIAGASTLRPHLGAVDRRHEPRIVRRLHQDDPRAPHVHGPLEDTPRGIAVSSITTPGGIAGRGHRGRASDGSRPSAERAWAPFGPRTAPTWVGGHIVCRGSFDPPRSARSCRPRRGTSPRGCGQDGADPPGRSAPALGISSSSGRITYRTPKSSRWIASPFSKRYSAGDIKDQVGHVNPIASRLQVQECGERGDLPDPVRGDRGTAQAAKMRPGPRPRARSTRAAEATPSGTSAPRLLTDPHRALMLVTRSAPRPRAPRAPRRSRSRRPRPGSGTGSSVGPGARRDAPRRPRDRSGIGPPGRPR